MEREHRSLGSGSVSTKEFQACLWAGLERVVERARARGMTCGTAKMRNATMLFSILKHDWLGSFLCLCFVRPARSNSESVFRH